MVKGQIVAINHLIMAKLYRKILFPQREGKMSDWPKEISVKALNPLHPNMSKVILYTVPHKFPKVLTRRICVTINSFFCC